MTPKYLIEWSPGMTLEVFEREVFKTAYIHYKFNLSTAARALGLSRATAYRIVKSHFKVPAKELKKILKEQRCLGI